MKTVAIIQARMGSTRLPGKIMKDLAGEPLLVRVVNRVTRARSLDDVVVATTTIRRDDAVAELCERRGWGCFRGSEDDVLDRYFRAAQAARADTVVRITSDCPLIEPALIDEAVGVFQDGRGGLDYVSNCHHERTYPRGLDVEVFSFAALERAWKEDANPSWREHVTLYMVRNPGRFRLHGISGDNDYSAHRWTVDTAEDLQFVRMIYGHFRHDRFLWTEVLALLDRNPHWSAINSEVRQKEVP